ncbi:hypothetical protein C2845_PM14G17950 [Panicum miliaceum]|uniref:Uncharacterized protein n=1 Tax=Panicum miliaceum TaxID=4540 RepID=A0A3L6PUI7_PANMI|nr:hypothetical protein C2845_PM14G17950 [Panicum miliaceum]
MSLYDGLAGVYPEEEEDRHAVQMGDSDYEEDESDQSTCKATEDTTPMDVKKGKDIQGIPWDRMNTTRDRYRQARLQQYANFENIPNSGRTSEKECTPAEKGQVYYEFQHNTRSVKSTILHFQLRNLVWATTRHDVYLMSYYSVLHWSALTREKQEIIDLQGHVAPCEKHHGNFSEGFYHTQVSTLAVKNNLLVTEPADFIHIFDVDSGYSRKQELDFFGEIAGISFSPDTEALFVGVHDRAYSSLLQFNRRRFYSYLDSAL